MAAHKLDAGAGGRDVYVSFFFFFFHDSLESHSSATP